MSMQDTQVKELADELEPIISEALEEWHLSTEAGAAEIFLADYIAVAVADYLAGVSEVAEVRR